MRTLHEVNCEELSLDDLYRLPPIPSGYETDVVYRLHRDATVNGTSWKLEEHRPKRKFRKSYDSGAPAEWLQSYADESPDALRFVGARDGKEVVGLLSWRRVEWNDTIWLLDIRTVQNRRRQGVGTALVNHLKDVTRESGARGISVETQINNAPAIRFYKKQGFEICGFNDHLYTNRDFVKQDVALFLFWEARLY